MSVQFTTHNPVVECANTECPNRSDQGNFQRVQIGTGKIVGGIRGWVIYLCGACAGCLMYEVRSKIND